MLNNVIFNIINRKRVILIENPLKKHAVPIFSCTIALISFLFMLYFWESNFFMSLICLAITAVTTFVVLKRLKPSGQYESNNE